jgi:hypothetical protein
LSRLASWLLPILLLTGGWTTPGSFGQPLDGTAGTLVQTSTDIVVFDVFPHGDHVHVGSVISITDRAGYDNQPFFIDEERLLFASIREGDQADVYRFDLFAEALEQVTSTPESEYSPRLTPDGEAISVVRVALDGVSQGLYRVPLDGGEAQDLLPDLDDIGYYAWAGPERVALFRVGEPASLYLADLSTGEAHHIADHVGGSLQSIPGTESVSFVDQSDPERWLVRRLDGGTGEVETVVDTPPGSVEHAWMSSSTLIMGHEGALYRYSVGGAEGVWIPLVDLRSYIGPFSRIAVSPSGLRIAVVTEEGR